MLSIGRSNADQNNASTQVVELGVSGVVNKSHSDSGTMHEFHFLFVSTGVGTKSKHTPPSLRTTPWGGIHAPLRLAEGATMTGNQNGTETEGLPRRNLATTTDTNEGAVEAETGMTLHDANETVHQAIRRTRRRRSENLRTTCYSNSILTSAWQAETRQI